MNERGERAAGACAGCGHNKVCTLRAEGVAHAYNSTELRMPLSVLARAAIGVPDTGIGGCVKVVTTLSERGGE